MIEHLCTEQILLVIIDIAGESFDFAKHRA